MTAVFEAWHGRERLSLALVQPEGTMVRDGEGCCAEAQPNSVEKNKETPT